MGADTGLSPGFDDPVKQCQGTFHAVLQALSRPGRVERLPSPEGVVPGLGAGSAAIALALVDFETPVWLDAGSSAAADYLRFHCGCVIVNDPMQSRFAFVKGFGALPALESFLFGTDEEPSNSATLIIEVDTLVTDGPLVLTGPGIEFEHHLGVSGFDAPRLAERLAMTALFPRGVDLFLTCDQNVVGIPRTTRITSIEG
jgi:alpha-D-ribose 1-methylphosphonate 5-triphosphate synthase subunit PhnH